jgi:hypothetical protein
VGLPLDARQNLDELPAAQGGRRDGFVGGLGGLVGIAIEHDGRCGRLGNSAATMVRDAALAR